MSEDSQLDLPDILRRIVEQRRRRIAESGPPPAIDRGPANVQTAASNPFLGALAAVRGRAVIAEVKMGSPRLGSLVGSFDPLAQARAYRSNGAAALSVVVEPDFFHGGYELLSACREASGLPTLAKDFIVDPVQLVWARRAGARAVLLIAALYTSEELRGYVQEARRLGLAPLVETHDLADLIKLEHGIWELIGINNRDLRTFEVELSTSMALLPSLPSGAIKVAESGIASGADIATLRSAGFDAFLIGEALVTAEDPGMLLRSLCEA